MKKSQRYKSKIDAPKRSKEFDGGDLVMVYLRKENFLGPCRIIKKLGPKAYHLRLPKGFAINPLFNVSIELYLFYKSEDWGTP